MNKIAVITCNMGSFDKPLAFVPQSMNHDHYHFSDENFPHRHCSMTPRLQARIPKMFGWQMAPRYEYYIWVDCSHSLRHENSVKWFHDQLWDADMALFKHPTRNNIQEEADHIKERLSNKCPYITPRYENELIEEQLHEIYLNKEFVDDRLYASTALIYRNTKEIQDMMVQWWYHTSRFHSVDQLALPYVIWKAGVKVKAIETPKTSNSKIICRYITKTRTA
jgi:hypothetical protein